jgi:fucose permease
MSSASVRLPSAPSQQEAGFRRDRITWVAYVMLAWFAYLQAAPGVVLPHLREEIHLSYAVGGLHIAAFATGSAIAGLISSRLDRLLGRAKLFWSAAVLLGVGMIGLTAGRVAVVTIGSVMFMGLGGGLLLVTIQALLVDRHGARSAIALTEANVAASSAYVVLIAVLSATAALHGNWRTALLASLVVPVLAWSRNRRLPIEAPPASDVVSGRLPGVFWVAGAMLVCTTSAEWCINAWGASFVEDAVGVSADRAVTLMIGYFAGVLGGRLLGSWLTHRSDPARLLAGALAVSAAGFVVFWPATTSAQAFLGLILLGIGLGNLFPLAISVTVALAPGQTALANGRAVAITSLAVLLAPLVVGALADATSIKASLGVMPVMIAFAATGLAFVQRARPRTAGASSGVDVQL